MRQTLADDQALIMSPMTPPQTQNSPVFAVGDRVPVTGGYDSHPAWLAGGEGYVGTIDEIEGERLVVKLDDEIELEADSAG